MSHWRVEYYIREATKANPTFFTICINGHTYGIWTVDSRWDWHLIHHRSKKLPFRTTHRIINAIRLMNGMMTDYANLSPKQLLKNILGI